MRGVDWFGAFVCALCTGFGIFALWQIWTQFPLDIAFVVTLPSAIILVAAVIYFRTT